MGYFRAGFEIVGVDNMPQKRYPFRFIQADALDYLRESGHCYDAIHASPPCQRFCSLRFLYDSDVYQARHPDLIAPTRDLLAATGKPYVIENVQGALKAMLSPNMLCGSMFGLQTSCGAQLQRHRLFEANWYLMVSHKCRHSKHVIGVYGTGMAQGGARTISVHGRPQMITAKRAVITVTGHTAQQNIVKNQVRKTYSVEQAHQAMGIEWMSQAELSQAIPPAYTEYVGRQFIEQV